jgi:hypothetical protein
VEQALREGRARERDQEEQNDEDTAADRDLVASEPSPNLLPVAARLRFAEYSGALIAPLKR